MAGKLLLIKIGGSLTTNKEKRCTPNPAFIKNFAKGFAAVYREFLTGASRSARALGRTRTSPRTSMDCARARKHRSNSMA